MDGVATIKDVMNALPCEVDVLVVGYGPVGAALAGLLGRYGVRTLVIDKARRHLRGAARDRARQRGAAHPADGRPRVRTLSPRSRSRTCACTARTSASSVASTPPAPSTVTRSSSPSTSPSWSAPCATHAERQPSVTARTGVEMIGCDDDGDVVRVTLRRDGSDDDVIVRARYVVGADGASSNVRQAIGAGLRGHDVRGGLADRRRPRRSRRVRPRRVPVRSRPPDAAHGRAGRPHALGVHAEARRDPRGDGGGLEDRRALAAMDERRRSSASSARLSTDSTHACAGGSARVASFSPATPRT